MAKRKLISGSIYIGIDPGFSGAIAILKHDGTLLGLHDMPIYEVAFVKNGKNKTRNNIDITSLVHILTNHPYALVYLEDVSARSGQGVTSMFRFGHGLGIVEGILSALGIKYHKVLPVNWKSTFNLVKQEKAASLTVARELFPTAELKLQKHHGRADALCIAEHCRRTNTLTANKV